MTDETYQGEALDSAMMLARLDIPATEIARQLAHNFEGLEAPAQLARDAVIAVAAERAADQ